MYSNNEQEEKELEALRLIDQAETLLDKGNGEEAINIYEKAAQIYLDTGSYIKIDEIFIRISEIISKFKNNIQRIYRLKSIIRKTEELKIYEISAKLLIQLGNIAFKMNDWETAGESWESASEYLYISDPEEFFNLSAILLLKAGQTFERSRIKKDLGKHLILKAVMKINKFDEICQIDEKRALALLTMKEYEPAAKKFHEIANNFRKALNNLDELIDEEESKDTLLNAKARFIHFVAEYQTIAALCLRASENREYNYKIKELGQDSINLFRKSINLQKQYLYSIESSDFDREMLYRITFDTMLLSILQEMLGTKQFDPLEFLLKNGEEHESLTKKLKKTPYYKISNRIKKVGARESLEKLLKTHLGHLEEIKNILISFFS
ncbi:MAG: hypothetical protein ACTSRI_05790 [Promethearchaeota archaeon]